MKMKSIIVNMQRNSFRFCAVLLMTALGLRGFASNNNLITNGKSDYKIFVSESAVASEKYAAAELQKYLYKISACNLEITHAAKQGDKLVYVGFKNAPESILKDLKPADFDNEEYIIRSDGKNLLLAGGGSRGTLYGVIGYLSDHLGCRWYTREVVKTPTQSTILLNKIEDRQKPAFEYREAYYHEAFNTEWALHNRLNPSRVPIPDSLGGSYIIYPFTHAFYMLVSPDKYFHSHPEYFSEVNGQRKGEDAQLCLTNPEVVKIATETVFDWIKTHPEANMFSIYQNDGYGYCECKNCKKVDDAEGSHSGSLLKFINQIADSVAKVYPKVKLLTFAYVYTEIPPKTIHPADNVTIQLCHYNYCSAHALGNCTSNEPFIKRLDQWRSIAKRIIVWDYFTDFTHFLMPFPNFELVKNDVKFYANRGIVGLFAQGSNVPDNGGGEFSELRAWVLSQLMWNPDQDGQRLIDEFINNVYGGSAGRYIREYVKLMHDSVRPVSVYFSIWSRPDECSYLTAEFIHKADSLFALAMEETKNDTALLKRVELAYLPVLYTQLHFYGLLRKGYLSTENFPEALSNFKRIIKEHQITRMAEPLNYGDIRKFIALAESAHTTYFVTDWWLIGPFDNSDKNGLTSGLPPEQGFDPAVTYSGKNGIQVKWKHYDDPAYGYIDFAKLFQPSENVVAYAYREMQVEDDKNMKIGIGSNGGVRVWINGKFVLDRSVSRKAEPNQDVVSIPLKKGKNTILVKVDQLAGGWGFYFTELDKKL